MKPAKKSAGKSAGEKPVAATEYVGNLCATNYWVKIGLMREELAALKPIAKLFKNTKHQTTGNALHLLITTALLHWDKLESYVFSDQKYCEAEGFEIMEQFRQAVLRRKFPDIKADGRGVGAKRGKRAKAFFKICMSQGEQAELRELAHAFEIDLRTFISHALLSQKIEYRDMIARAEENHLDPRILNHLANELQAGNLN
jgi:hypothetical protein